MAEIGEPSQVRADESVDKHIIHIEQPIVEPVVEPMIETDSDAETDPEEDQAVMMAEPVRGGVMRFSDDDEDDQIQDQTADSDEDAEGSEDDEEPEEALQGTEVVGYHDDMGTTADDIIDELTTRNGELEERVLHLEQQNQTHQLMEDRYRDVAHQTLGERTDLRDRYQIDAQRIASLEQMVQLREQRIAELQAQLMAMSVEYDRERTDRAHIHEAWVRAATRVDEVTAENRAYEARFDRASLAIDTAFGRLRRRVRRYGREEYLSRQAISRRVVDRIAQQEHESAILRADL